MNNHEGYLPNVVLILPAKGEHIVVGVTTGQEDVGYGSRRPRNRTI